MITPLSQTGTAAVMHGPSDIKSMLQLPTLVSHAVRHVTQVGADMHLSNVWFRKGYANIFTYDCGLKASTGQAYAHVTEERNDNTSFMGLILQKYIPEVARLNQDNWAGNVIEQTSDTCCHGDAVLQPNLQDLHIGVVANESDLTTYFDNYIMNPVISKAMPGSGNQQDGGSSSRCAHHGHASHITCWLALRSADTAIFCTFTLVVLLQNKDNCCSWRGIPPLYDCLEYQAYSAVLIMLKPGKMFRHTIQHSMIETNFRQQHPRHLY